MLTRNGTWKLRWKILALLTVLVLGVTTMTDAQDQTKKRNPAEIKADIKRLQAELKEAETKEPKKQRNEVVRQDFRVDVGQDDSLQVGGKKMTLQELVRLLKDEPKETIKTVVLTLDPNATYENMLKVLKTLTSQEIENLQFSMNGLKIDGLPGSYHGWEGDDRISIIIGEAKDGIYPITVLEDGLIDRDPNDDAYEGTAKWNNGKLDIKLTRKYDGNGDEPVEKALQNLTALFAVENGKVVLAIPKNREWDAVKATKEVPSLVKQVRERTIDLLAQRNLPGSYLGYEGDDRFGIVLGEPKNSPSANTYPITIYEDGLPGQGYDPNDDDRYEGTAVLKDGKLEITLTKKFDENVEEPVEKPLRKLTATIGSENGKTTISIPKNREWDAVKVTKE